MNNPPLVSIVTPSYNQARFLEQTIQSVLSQDYPQVEYWVMDGGSNDGSVDILRKYDAQLAGWVSERDKGQTDAINKGFARATGQIFAWLNSDDYYYPGAIRAAVDFLQANPAVGMVYGNADLVDESGTRLGDFPARQTDYARLLTGSVHIPQQAAFWRADLWRQIAPLDESFYFAMDYDLWVRLAKLAPIVYTPQKWAAFRLHGSGKTSLSDDRCWPEMLKVQQRETGKFFSKMRIKYYLRRTFYAWLPLSVRLRLRRFMP
ncbi:MAG: hypothetical protein OHK0052_11060 [Anaerolineales bacterium]